MTPRSVRANETAVPTVLDPGTAQRVASLKIRASRVVQGLLGGMHRSPSRGASIVFAEHRAYRPGDDLRLLDWRAFARTDRHAVKRFEQETQLRATLLLDRSPSMSFNGIGGTELGRTELGRTELGRTELGRTELGRTELGRAELGRAELGFPAAPTKREYAATLLAAIAYLLNRQGDAVGASGFDIALHTDGVPPRTRASHFEAVLGVLAGEAVPASSSTNLYRALSDAGQRSEPRGLVFIASDLLDPQGLDGLRALGSLRARGHQVTVFHVLHPHELRLPEVGAARFVDPEGELSVDTETGSVQRAYARQMQSFLDEARRLTTEAGARYQLAPTDQPPEHILSQVLRSRQRGSRSQSRR